MFLMVERSKGCEITPVSLSLIAHVIGYPVMTQLS